MSRSSAEVGYAMAMTRYVEDSDEVRDFCMEKLLTTPPPERNDRRQTGGIEEDKAGTGIRGIRGYRN